jgi:hypothetical protein
MIASAIGLGAGTQQAMANSVTKTYRFTSLQDRECNMTATFSSFSTNLNESMSISCGYGNLSTSLKYICLGDINVTSDNLAAGLLISPPTGPMDGSCGTFSPNDGARYCFDDLSCSYSATRTRAIPGQVYHWDLGIVMVTKPTTPQEQWDQAFGDWSSCHFTPIYDQGKVQCRTSLTVTA